ncbi:MAG: substrate-binding domain-containing protein [Acidimicrobiia bacterium]|nr:substrate-binding domain-containing protein [Acidimicrobiia bacterium]
MVSGQRRPTMRDVAAEAGVSFKTVSRVVNHEGGVSDDLVRRVQLAVDSLGYRPDHRARLLRRTSSEAATIGFVLVDVGNVFFSNILRGIEEVASTRGCLVLAGSTEGSPERERQLVDAFVERRVAGLIVVSSGAAAMALRSEMRRGTPVVFLDLEPDSPDPADPPDSADSAGSHTTPDFGDIDLVRSDHRAGAINATRHLLAHGHRDVAYFGDDSSIFSARLRLEGYQEAMAEAGLTVEPDRIVTGSYALAWADRIVDYFSHRPHPTAIFTAQNLVTLGAVRALHQLGLRDTIAHVGFDDIDLADAVSPDVSVVPQHPRRLGQQAAELLFARLDGDDGPAVQQIVESPVIERGSGEIRPTGTPGQADHRREQPTTDLPDQPVGTNLTAADHTIATAAELRALYREPSKRVKTKKGTTIAGAAADFVARSPFFCLATADADGRCDVSPRGGPAGLLKVLDDGRAVAFPDLSGNNLVDSLTNIVGNPRAGVLVLVPGSDETLRIDGPATITTDPAILGLWSDQLRTPKVAVVVEIEATFLHCAKAFRRSSLWDSTTWPEVEATEAPRMFNAVAGTTMDPAEMRDYLEADYAESLENERPTNSEQP